jgi:putative SOS response-associated peptidase YedK
MCYDISFSMAVEMVTDYIPDLIVDPQIGLEYDMIVHAQAQAFKKYPVVLEQQGKKHLKPLEWGLIADYMDDAEKIKKARKSMCNARAERVIGDKKSIWHRIRKQRCLIPVTGIMDHREIKGWKNKVPYHVWLKDRKMFCIPGFYNYPKKVNKDTGHVTYFWTDSETGEPVGTYALVTRDANTTMKQIHNGGENAFRMPLFLPKEMEMKWLDPTLTDDEIQKILDFEMPSEMLEYQTTWSIRSPKERPDGKGKLDPYEWPGLPPLGVESAEQTLF